MIELHELRQFVTFADAGTLSEAAEILHLSQPALSRNMKKLEEHLEITLFDRQKNKLMLNDPEVSQDTVDAAVTEIQNAIDALEPASSASVDGAGTAASSDTSSSVTNTAAQAQTGLFIGVLAVAACGILLMVIKKRRNKA